MRSIWFVAVMTPMMAGAALAQEQGQVGVAMGYPASVGIVWHAAERVALRPEFTFNQGTTDSTLVLSVGNQTRTTQLSSTNTSFGAGMSGLFYLRKRDALSAFLSPRYTYSRRSTTSLVTTDAPSSETPTTTHEMSGSFGAQYAMARRFSVFGEVGVVYGTSASDTLSISGRSELKNHSVGMRTAVGVVLYFQ